MGDWKLNKSNEIPFRLVDENGDAVTSKIFSDLTIKVFKPATTAAISVSSGTLTENTGSAIGGEYAITLASSFFNTEGENRIEISGTGFIDRIISNTVSSLYNDIAQLKTYTDILDDATNGLANIKTIVSGIKTKTDNLPANTSTSITELKTLLESSTYGLSAINDNVVALASGVWERTTSGFKANTGTFGKVMAFLSAIVINDCTINKHIVTHTHDDGDTFTREIKYHSRTLL